uniref:GPALPP motifs-containing protein 1 n=1 Tax=Oryzias latipes TaxID=8090 RepID=A0A3P9JH16_ORYLA
MSSEDLIGPALPPMFLKESSEDELNENDFAGPALPPGYKREEASSSSDESEPEIARKRAKTGHSAGDRPEQSSNEDDGFFGPALPPGFKKQESSPERRPIVGPALPPGFCKAAQNQEDDSDGEDGECLPGPALPPGYRAESSNSEGEDEEVIGPMPAKGPVQYSVALDIERRAKRMKDKLTGVETPALPTRETWMTELPPELQHIGLGARTFKKRTGPENKDRSIWTDTPSDRERKARERLEGKNKKESEKKDDVTHVSRKDLEMAEKVSKYNESKRAESLMTLHAKKMKEKAKDKADQPVERRPFDRDADLQVNRFDEAQKKQLLKKSQELNTRFSHSKDKMFL